MEIGLRVKAKNELYKKVYQLWYNMVKRCHKSSHPRYGDYKDVHICSRWMDLDNFIEDIDKIKGFDVDLFLEGKLYLDKDANTLNNKIYCLEGCEFVTQVESNKRKPNQQTHFKAVSPKGVIYYHHNQSEFARKFDLSQSKISECIRGEQSKHKGWVFTLIEGYCNDYPFWE